MSEINWDLAPKDATEIVKVALAGQKWRNPETKQYWSMNGDFGGYYSENSPIDEGSIFATRPQTKTVADEGDKWTHTYYNNLCLIVAGEPDRHGYIAIKTEKAGYQAVDKDAVKPIKPKLTKSDAWDRCVEEFGVRNIKYVMQELMEEFEII